MQEIDFLEQNSPSSKKDKREELQTVKREEF